MTELVIEPEDNFQHILRVANTNVDGSLKIYVAMTAITGLGKRMSVLCCRKAGVDPLKRAGSCLVEKIDRIVQVMNEPGAFNIPEWLFNRQKDYKTGKNKHCIPQNLGSAIRD